MARRGTLREAADRAGGRLKCRSVPMGISRCGEGSGSFSKHQELPAAMRQATTRKQRLKPKKQRDASPPQGSLKKNGLKAKDWKACGESIWHRVR